MNNRFELKGFIIWSICVLFFLYEFYLRTVLGSYQNTIMSDLKLTSMQFSLLSTTAFVFFYGIMQIPVGIIISNIGLKKSMIIGCFFCVLSSFGFAYVNSYYIALIYRAIGGFGASFGFICLLSSINDWMPSKYNAIFIGISQFLGTLGPIIAGFCDECSKNDIIANWRNIFLFVAFLGIGILILILIFIENKVERNNNYIILNKPESARKMVKYLFGNIQPWFIAVACAFMYFPIEYLSENEGRNFVIMKGISSVNASYAITLSWFGYAIANPTIGLISDFMMRRKIILILCSLIGVYAIYVVVYLDNVYLILSAFFLLGFAASSVTVGFATVTSYFKRRCGTLGIALNNFMITFSIAIVAPLFAWLLESETIGTDILSRYTIVLSILFFLMICALIIALFGIKETFCKSVVDFTYLRRDK